MRTNSVTCLCILCEFCSDYFQILIRLWSILMFIVSKSGGLIFNYDHNLPATKTEKTIQLTVGYIKVENQPCRALHVFNIWWLLFIYRIGDRNTGWPISLGTFSFQSTTHTQHYTYCISDSSAVQCSEVNCAVMRATSERVMMELA